MMLEEVGRLIDRSDLEPKQKGLYKDIGQWAHRRPMVVGDEARRRRSGIMLMRSGQPARGS
jgi:hypothetical protein